MQNMTKKEELHLEKAIGFRKQTRQESDWGMANYFTRRAADEQRVATALRKARYTEALNNAS